MNDLSVFLCSNFMFSFFLKNTHHYAFWNLFQSKKVGEVKN